MRSMATSPLRTRLLIASAILVLLGAALIGPTGPGGAAAYPALCGPGQRPDLIITSVVGSSFTVANTGTCATARPFTVRAGGSGFGVRTAQIDEFLAPGDVTSFAFVGVPSGTFLVRVTADSENQIRESDETNNTRLATVTVSDGSV